MDTAFYPVPSDQRDQAHIFLPDDLKTRLRTLRDQRISADGVVVIKIQKHRRLERNREDAVVRSGN